ncbi:three-Cys-motif partner protein TcmP [Methylomonas rapida]|uniref:Three-Cys-motif partner protein TcmP n=1 Tax=Methylomonas rapida TaxID=2963939 RepID=A0ABY7GIB7_9GAMM|nr:three-Cys-motif partner protein TcmP [Methylomonas rapida]WAR44599.1 three-Cys-motif partner protein TcmP [Methylomonas rapida]
MFEEGKIPNDQHSFGGSWTCIKLEALEKYLAAFNTALSKQSFTRIYIDGFAGTGRCDITMNGEKTSVDGSARRALAVNPPFNKFCFIELDAKKMAALKSLQAEYPEKSIDIIQDDANAALKEICKNYNWKNTRAVLFLDPYGLHVEWSTLEAIAATKAIDVWYLFPYSGLYRQTAKNANALDADKENSITRILGTDEWRKEFYKPQRQADLFGDESGDEREANHHDMLNYVSKRLKGLFPAVTGPKILFQAGDSKKPSGAPLFALYFAASNPSPKAFGLATKIAKDVLNAL